MFKRSIYILLLIVFGQLTLGYSQTNTHLEVKSNPNTILLLNSYHRGFKWSDDITDAVLKELRDTSKFRVFVEYMDSKRFKTETYFKEINRLFKHKYTEFPINGIICSDNTALDYILASGDSIWGKVPVVFCGINQVNQYLSKIDTSRFCGVEEKMDVLKTIQMARLLQPDLDEFIVVGDNSLMYPIFRQQFVETINNSGLNIKYHEIIVETAEQLRNELAKEDTNGKAIYLFSLYLNNNGFIREMSIEARSVFKDIQIPVYSNWDFLIPDLIVGGSLESGEMQGRLAADIMINRLTGNVKNMPFAIAAPTKLIFDYEQLKRFDFDSRVLPYEKIIFNKNKGIFERYKTEMLIIVGFLVSLICIIVLLISVIIFRRKAEKELIESETRLELALEGANQGLWDIDLDSNSLYINKQVASLLKYPTPKMLGINIQNWVKLFHPQDIEHLMEAVFLHKTHRTESINCELRMKTFDGEYTWLSLHGKVTAWDGDLPTRYTGSLIDINAQKEFENQLRFAKEKAEESDRLKSSFLANMSHEIRTPMNAILGFADLVTTDLLSDDERKDYLMQIKWSGESLLNLINDIIDISKIESGQLVMIPEKFVLSRLLDKVDRMVHSLIRNCRKEIEFQIIRDEAADRVIYCDQMRLEQVILNLLTNAIKFTHDGKITLRYHFVDHQYLKFYVTDTGIGIAPEYKKVIFERFRQGDESLAKQYGGNGLGLTISRSLVKMLGGDIDVHSVLGEGSEFSFSIKVHPVEILV